METERWDALFADLEGELDGEQARDLDAEVRDRAQVEHARLTLADRLTAQAGTHVAVTTNGAGVLRGRLTGAARDWLMVGDTLVPRLAILGVSGLGDGATEPEGRPRAPRTIAAVLRGMEGPVTCVFTDGRTVTATVERVGKDHVDLDGTAVPFRAIAAIHPA
jgi:hypothetical protein